MTLNSLEDVLPEQVKDLRSAETQLVEALPKVARAAIYRSSSRRSSRTSTTSPSRSQARRARKRR